ncbi:transforming growth factor beta regulator 1 [Haplosporangium sp. Z 27]|nr:transforming growth factor beta regulator 1 [Haplosporangium sp. Z 27]
MKDDPLSFKEKYLRLRERFDRVSATQRQYTNDLQVARLKARKLKEENNHLLDLLSDMQQMNGSGPSSDSDTSMDDLSDFDDDEDDELREEGLGGQRHERSGIGRADATIKSPSTSRSRRDTTSGHGTRAYMNMAGSSHSAGEGIENGSQSNNNKQTSNTHSNQAHRPGPNIKKEKPEGAPKQTRKATASKRADRGRPRAVVPLPTNPDGRIVWQGRGYHNHRYIFPVGFRSKKQYTSLSDTSKKTYFINEILDGGEQPIFQITLEDMPDKVFRHSSSSGAWELALKGLMELGYNAKTHASGPDMYGLTNLGVIKYIQEMPNAHRCRRYMPLKWIIEEDDTNTPQSPNGEAGPKSPGRKKKINNSLYASNHEVLLETMEEAARVKTSSTSKPSTPRKNTKRKPVPDYEHSPVRLAPPAPVSESESGMDPMEDVKHEIDRSSVTPILPPSPLPPMASMAPTTALESTIPRSLAGQEPHYPNIPPIQENLRSKGALHYENPYEQSLMEP